LATFEQSLIKISINFTLHYGVPLVDSAVWLTQHSDHNKAGLPDGEDRRHSALETKNEAILGISEVRDGLPIFVYTE
jgi:hypothetical protein